VPGATIALGRDCSFTVGGATLSGVRSVSASQTRTEIEYRAFASNEAFCFAGHRTLSIEVETISSGDWTTLQGAMDSGDPVTVSTGHVSASFIVTSLTISEPLDDVVSYTATLKRTLSTSG
jgi:hypothetical protein